MSSMFRLVLLMIGIEHKVWNAIQMHAQMPRAGNLGTIFVNINEMTADQYE